MKRAFMLFLAAVMVLTMTACGGTSATQSTREIVVVPEAWSDELDKQIKEHVKDRPELNVYQNSSEEPDALYQSLLVEDLMAQEVDAICLQMVDETVQLMADQAEAAGIVIVIGDDFPAMIDQAAETLKN